MTEFGDRFNRMMSIRHSPLGDYITERLDQTRVNLNQLLVTEGGIPDEMQEPVDTVMEFISLRLQESGRELTITRDEVIVALSWLVAAIDTYWKSLQTQGLEALSINGSELIQLLLMIMKERYGDAKLCGALIRSAQHVAGSALGQEFNDWFELSTLEVKMIADDEVARLRGETNG